MISGKTREAVLAVAKRLAQQAITHAAGIPGNVSGAVREDAAAEYIEDRVRDEVEARDHLIPTIGKYLDLPLADLAQRGAERLIIRAFVKQVYTADALRRLSGPAL
ncbi:hypothetical protein ACFFLM_21250 [Deinococcus oregonensis]|uniref:Uncharacterized protein n=1 Tax=Deinococcus oregonensis TaxID=1805970 RepID=A0ABV6B426_9DEIO